MLMGHGGITTGVFPLVRHSRHHRRFFRFRDVDFFLDGDLVDFFFEFDAFSERFFDDLRCGFES